MCSFILQRMSTVDRSEGFYHVLRQPIPIESLSVHDIGPAEASISNMKNLFVVVQRNSFQQVIGVFTLQAHTSLGKVCIKVKMYQIMHLTCMLYQSTILFLTQPNKQSSD